MEVPFSLGSFLENNILLSLSASLLNYKPQQIHSLYVLQNWPPCTFRLVKKARGLIFDFTFGSSVGGLMRNISIYNDWPSDSGCESWFKIRQYNLELYYALAKLSTLTIVWQLFLLKMLICYSKCQADSIRIILTENCFSFVKNIVVLWKIISKALRF
jgi:hypothetical protein